MDQIIRSYNRYQVYNSCWCALRILAMQLHQVESLCCQCDRNQRLALESARKCPTTYRNAFSKVRPVNLLLKQ